MIITLTSDVRERESVPQRNTREKEVVTEILYLDYVAFLYFWQSGRSPLDSLFKPVQQSSTFQKTAKFSFKHYSVLIKNNFSEAEGVFSLYRKITNEL